LRRHAVPFHAICVVTAAALDAPDAIMDFFEEENVAEVGFNVDEREGARTCSSLTGPDIRERFAVFMTRALERAERPGAPMIREGRRLLTSLLDPRFNAATGNDENEPFRIVTVLWDGRLSTFSPELSGLSHPVLGEMVFGNVRADSLPAILASDRFRRAATEVATGVAACRAECAYFRLCRGGAPANKLAELGTFAGTETQHCRLSQQAVADVILTRLRATLSRCDSDSRKGSLYLTATRDT
jgi:uncharacterized protein